MLFQFYCSPIRSSPSCSYSLPTSYISILLQSNQKGVRLGGTAHGKQFQFYCSPIRRVFFRRGTRFNYPFQFYCSPIRSPIPKGLPKIQTNFNSTVVQLEGGVELRGVPVLVFQFYCSPIRSQNIGAVTQNVLNFNSTVVQLEVKHAIFKIDFKPISILLQSNQKDAACVIVAIFFQISILLQSNQKRTAMRVSFDYVAFQFYCSPIRSVPLLLPREAYI